LESDALLNLFSEIEAKVEKMIDLCRLQQTANFELQQKVRQLEEELNLKNEAAQRHAEEKTLIRSRVDNLLAKLENLTRS